ncbi:hypothetical protein HG537_0B06010 [Torulaspora globosa]|uniref:Histone acetyltransferase type B catalytic subunit n=1 Tax=Torulaspora globosa TaxID=48254 RepID=A0A7H9HNA1_9SACH|nr:hypothetical protein HG537_0B06010 [Torulaspora sp. CBS 2947]
MSIADFQPAIWTNSSNSALKISLVSDNAIQFSPVFTYPVYGDSEQIFGYQDLVIHLAFDSITFKPFVNVKYSARLDEGSDDAEGKLLSCLPKDDVVLKDEAKWVDCFQKERETYKLPSQDCLIDEYVLDGETFAVYQTKVTDPSTEKLHRRIQIFSLLFIEAASYIDQDDPNWEIFWLFNKENKQCIGYATTYKLWHYTGSADFDKPENIKYRARISQFIILPPYQGKGHGSHLYEALFSHWIKDASVTEVTVEDPNENFDDLRDRKDLQRLYESHFFNQMPKDGEVSQEWIESNRAKYKIEKRQFNRLVEMIMMHTNSPQFRLQVKRRLYVKNYDSLIDMPEAERKDALQKSFVLLAEDYKRIVAKCRLGKRPTESDDQNAGAKKVKC